MQRAGAGKRKILDSLGADAFDETLAALRKLPSNRAFSALYSALCSPDTRIKTRAGRALGILVDELARKDLEAARNVMRNLMWRLNDESGGIGWNASQTIAEIILLIPELLDVYGSMMIAYTLREPQLVNSGLWSIGRVGYRMKEAVEFFRDTVLETFHCDDPQTLGLASWAVGKVGFASALPHLEELMDRSEPVRIYIDSSFCEKPLGEWAREGIRRISEVPD